MYASSPDEHDYCHTHGLSHTCIHAHDTVQAIIERIVVRTMPLPRRDFIKVSFIIECGGEVVYDHAKAHGLYACVK